MKNTLSRLLCMLLVTCFSAHLASSQQPDLRVRLLSLYHLRQIRLIPLDTRVTIRTCPGCPSNPLSRPTDVTTSDSHVVVAGQAHRSVLVSGRVRIEGPNSSPLTITSPLTIRSAHAELMLIASLPVEDYVTAAVQGESSGAMPDEALKALAISVRSYAIRFRPRHAADGFDFCDSTHCQYLRIENAANVRHAVDETRNQLLWFRGTPAATFHHQDCGGKRESARHVWPDVSAPYLQAKEDPYCSREKRDWTSTIDQSQLERALVTSGITLPRGWERIVVLSRTPAGRAIMLRFDGRSGTGPLISASSLRFAVGRTLGWNMIKSDLYEVMSSHSRVTFTGRGTGHGVGLCQLGAIEMAREGRSYRDILNFYFPGTTLGVSAQGIEWKKTSGARLDVLTTGETPGTAELLLTSERLLREAEARSGIILPFRSEIKVFPTVAMFRDSTGDPGWVAASTRGHTIRLQPPELLGKRGELEPALRHELLHLAIESKAHAATPMWFREGIVLYLADDPVPPVSRKFTIEELEATLRARTDAALTRQAYAAAKQHIAVFVRQHGKDEVFRWLNYGLPVDVARSW